MNSSVNTSNITINRSGHARIQYTGVDVAVQTEYVSDQQKLQINKRGCTNKIKSACARICSICCVSIETSRKAVQIVCKDLYDHNLYFSSNEQIMAEGVQPQPVVCTSFSQDYYRLQAIKGFEIEREAANELLNKNENSKAIIHFDTTGRSSVDGEWLSAILSFTDGLEHRLRPFFFAYEDRQ